MQLILFRHGIALEPDEAAAAGIREHERPLTPQGIARTRDSVEGLRTLVDAVQLIAHSPLTRARQTADLLAEAYPSARRAETRALKPGTAPETLAQFVAQRARREAVEPLVLVGHEPDLGQWAAWALTGRSQTLFGLKKAGACLLEFEDRPETSKARLLWLLTAGQLRKLG
ncbi:MAG TPA: histidine phosphatase family protein [Nevskiales bacterium]|nr:histidine phosphatase family protein [Nevskiales bacterium]